MSTLVAYIDLFFLTYFIGLVLFLCISKNHIVEISTNSYGKLMVIVFLINMIHYVRLFAENSWCTSNYSNSSCKTSGNWVSKSTTWCIPSIVVEFRRIYCGWISLEFLCCPYITINFSCSSVTFNLEREREMERGTNFLFLFKLCWTFWICWMTKKENVF